MHQIIFLAVGGDRNQIRRGRNISYIHEVDKNTIPVKLPCAIWMCKQATLCYHDHQNNLMSLNVLFLLPPGDQKKNESGFEPSGI